MQSKAKRRPRAAARASDERRTTPVDADRVKAAAPHDGENSAPPELPRRPEPVAELASPAGPAVPENPDVTRDTYAALASSQEALARGLEAMSIEFVGIARFGMDRAARAASDLLAAKTLTDAMEVNAGLARDTLDSFVGGSARLSEISMRLARDATEPLIAQIGKSWALTFWTNC